MAFTSAKEALFFLGLTEKAGREQVKSAYTEQIFLMLILFRLQSGP